MYTYLGHAVLNGPGGAGDTPEVFLPIEPIGVPTEYAVVIAANSRQEAREKQVLWHCIMERIFRLTHEPNPVPQYAQRKREALKLLQALADKVLL